MGVAKNTIHASRIVMVVEDLPQKYSQRPEMTPFEMEILIWYYCRADDHPVIERNPPIWPETLKHFLDEELLMKSHIPGQTYTATPRCAAYVKSLLRVPYPEQAWITRWPQKEHDQS